MLKWFRKKTPDIPKPSVPEKSLAVDERSPDAYGVTKIPRYPPFMEGIPGQSVTVGRLLEDQAKLMKRIRHRGVFRGSTLSSDAFMAKQSGLDNHLAQ